MSGSTYDDRAVCIQCWSSWSKRYDARILVQYVNRHEISQTRGDLPIIVSSNTGLVLSIPKLVKCEALFLFIFNPLILFQGIAFSIRFDISCSNFFNLYESNNTGLHLMALLNYYVNCIS